MTTALVVDDSTVDRELVSKLLTSGTSLDVQFADNGANALAKIGQSPPQIIITDLHMPELDGLQLVEAVHAEYSTVPIVLITGKGSEELAVQALKKGAASYVPKESLAKDLVTTVMQVLAVARAQHSLKEVRKCWEETRCTFRLPNDYNLISPVVGQLKEIVDGMQLLDSTERVQLSMALEEAVSNALYHGNLELTTEQLNSVGYDLDDPDQENIVDARRATSPYQERNIFIAAELSRARVKFTIRDEGPGFEHAELPAPEDVVASGALSGRGLAKMRLFVDEMSFNAKGNEVVLVKYA